MCFSASASFGASAVLGVIGIIAVTKAKSGPQRLFAATPLIFAVQQVTEGLLWISLKDQTMESEQSLLTYIYLVFAMAVWPLWVPLSIRLLEKDTRSKKLMNVLVCIGALVAICVVLILSLYPVQVMTPLCLNCPFSSTPSINQHLHYRFSLPPIPKGLIGAFSVLYIMATIVTPFISIHKKMKWLGLAFLISYLFAVIFYDGFVISIWCFFAALLSFVVLWILSDINKISEKP
jgi:hypothetical protein